LRNLSGTFDIAHGGTYIGKCKVEYSVPGSPALVTRETTVPGGQTHTMDEIPLEAADLTISIDFVSGGHVHFSFASPASAWTTGQCTIDMFGVWPGGAHAAVRNQ
jgi:hypothetical protein